MKEIVIVGGVYGFRNEAGRVQPISKGGTAYISDDEAARLVGLGIAAYTEEGSETETETETEKHNEGGSDENPNEAEISKLERMTKADLEQMAKDMGVDVSGAKNKRKMAVIIAAADGDIEDVPDLGDGDIVP